MSTITDVYAASPTTPVGTEKVMVDNASGVTKGVLSGDIAKLFNGTKGADIASAATTDIGAATGMYVNITGTTTITGLGTVAAGTLRIVRFAGALTLTHNATSLILPRGGANIVTAADDCAIFESEGSGNWRCVFYQRKNGQPLSNAVTAVSSSSGVLNIDCLLGDYFTITLTENVTSLTFSNLPATGSGRTIMLKITQHASAAKTFAFPSSLKWAGSSVGVISSTTSAVDVLAITTFDQGTSWQATLAKAFA